VIYIGLLILLERLTLGGYDRMQDAGCMQKGGKMSACKDVEMGG
jgi:hypothetical protein